MNVEDAIKYVHAEMGSDKNGHPEFRPGDNIAVSYKIAEGDKVRIQVFRGNVIQINGEGATKSFTVRKISNGVGVERIFPLNSPHIDEIQVLKRGYVRRAKLFYLRKAIGKKGRIREKKRILTEAQAPAK